MFILSLDDLLYNITMSTALNFNCDWNYPLQCLRESELIRAQYHGLMTQVDKAMENEAVINGFQTELQSHINSESDVAKRTALENFCRTIEPAFDDSLSKAVNNRTDQVATGVDKFNYTVFDPYSTLDDEINDRMSSMCMRNYVQSGLEFLAPTFARDLDKYAMCCAYVDYNDKKQIAKVTRFNPKNVWWDTRYSATGEERFRAWSKMISWRKLKLLIDDYTINTGLEVPETSIFTEKVKDGKKEIIVKSRIRNKHLKTLNDMDVYIDDMNKMAENADFQNRAVIQGDYGDYSHTLINCYNLNYYRSWSTDSEVRSKSLYNSDDVELTTFYDLDNGIEFIIINRIFVIAANSKAFHRRIAMRVEDPRNGTIRTVAKKVELPCPLVFGYRYAEIRDNFPYPYSIVMKYIPYFDRIIANESKKLTIQKIVTRLRVRADAGNARELSHDLGIFGQIFTDLQGDVSTLQLGYDFTPIQNQIQEDKQAIVDGMNAYNTYDLMLTMGNRASAQEAGLVKDSIAQGVVTLSLALETFYAEVTRASLMQFVVYGNNSKLGIINRGRYSTVALQEMALDAIIDVKTKSTAQTIQQRLATNVLQLAATFKDSPMIDNEVWLPFAFSMASYGQIPVAIARTFVKQPDQSPEDKAAARQNAANTAVALQQNQQMYQTDPIPYEVRQAMGNLSPAEQQGLLKQLSSGQSQPQITQEELSAHGLSPQDVAALTGNGGVPTYNNAETSGQSGAAVGGMPGMTSDSGAIAGNPNAQ